MKLNKGQIVENVIQLPGNKSKTIVCRVIEFVDAVGMYRLTDARETRDDAWLIAHDRTWAAPIENIRAHDSDCDVCHKDGLVSFRG